MPGTAEGSVVVAGIRPLQDSPLSRIPRTHRFSELLANTGADGMFSRQIARCNHHKRKAEAVELYYYLQSTYDATI